MTFLGKLFGFRKDTQQTAISDEASELIARLAEQDMSAINELADLGDRGAVIPLIALMEIGNHLSSRYAATIVLGRLGDQRAVKPLLDQLQDSDPTLRKTSAKALGRFGDKSTVVPLIALLKDSNQDVRHDVAEALGDIGDSRAVKPLQSLSHDKDWVRQAAAQALKNIAG